MSCLQVPTVMANDDMKSKDKFRSGYLTQGAFWENVQKFKRKLFKRLTQIRKTESATTYAFSYD